MSKQKPTWWQLVNIDGEIGLIAYNGGQKLFKKWVPNKAVSLSKYLAELGETNIHVSGVIQTEYDRLPSEAEYFKEDKKEDSMKINQAGLELIKEFEGLYLNAYICPAGVATIGWGTTIYPDGSAVKIGDTCTKEQAEEYLRWDLENKYCRHVLESNIYPKLKNENEFSALVSFVYNVGRGGLHAPNSINRRITNGEDYKTVIKQELPRWNKGDGGVLAGLVRRRQAELDLFFDETPILPGDTKYFVGEFNEEIKQYQKALNLWLAKLNKQVLTVDGWFGDASLSASNDFAKNNGLNESVDGLLYSVYDKVIAWYKAETKGDNPDYNQPDIKVYDLSQRDLQLSANFRAGEFFSKDGANENLISTEMVELLQKMRDELGVPLLINSAYRSNYWNNAVGGAVNSRHLVGDACDISILNIDWRKVVECAKRVGFRGIGYGQNRGFIHVDLGAEREWDY